MLLVPFKIHAQFNNIFFCLKTLITPGKAIATTHEQDRHMRPETN
jgi:hypothetical protein